MSAYTFEEMTELQDELHELCSNWGLCVERCRHPSVTHPVFWLFRDGEQIATLSINRGEPWFATMMHQGQPYAQQQYSTLPAAFGWVRGMLAKRKA